MHTHAEIQAYAKSVTVPRGTMTSGTRSNLETLAMACGYPAASVSAVRISDLYQLWTSAKASGASAVMVAARIARANGVTIDGAAFSSASPDIFGLGTPEPAPTPSAPPMAEPGEYVTFPALEHALKETLAHARECARDDNATLADKLTGKVERLASSLPELIAEALASRTATNLVVTMPSAAPVAVGLVHRATPRILRALAAGLNVYLHGPAGSGKTTVGRICSEALGVPFYTAAKVESEYLLLGFRDAKGDVVRTPFREAYQNGGVFLFDELDASSPGAIVALNMALANGVCPFPDGLVTRHADFYCVAAGNTVLNGASRQYAGRNQMDAASVDRFYFVEFDYDEALETELATNKAWCAHVQAVRAAVKERGVSHLVTPRATFDGCKALVAGDTWEEAEMSCIFKGLDTDTVTALRRAVADASRSHSNKAA